MKSDLIERMYERRTFGIKPGLLMEETILKHLDNPHHVTPVIHVAGSNGKGSVCSMVECALRSAGIRTGRYTSPHLVKFNERFAVCGEDIDDDELYSVAAEVESAAVKASKELGYDATFFECSTAMAFLWFRQKGVQVAVLETGLGGRLDATNVVLPVVSVITRIAKDHSQYLGEELADIAGEKAGIIKKSRPVVIGAMDDVCRDVIVHRAESLGSAYVCADKYVSVVRKSLDLHGQKCTVETEQRSYGTVNLPLLGEHQLENLATAVAACDIFMDSLAVDIDPRILAKGISCVSWPGRFFLLKESPVTILDGAHNPDAAGALMATIEKLLSGRPIGMVIGMCSDKDAEGVLKVFCGYVRKMWTVPIGSERGMDPAVLSRLAESVGFDSESCTLYDALCRAEEWAVENDGAVCICGSLFLVGNVMETVSGGWYERQSTD